MDKYDTLEYSWVKCYTVFYALADLSTIVRNTNNKLRPIGADRAAVLSLLNFLQRICLNLHRGA